MAVMHYIDRARGISFAEFADICTQIDVQVYLLNLLSDPNWCRGLHRILDFSQVTRFEFSLEEAETAMERVVKLPEISRWGGLAAVAPRNLILGADRVFLMMLAAASPDLQVFSSRREALKHMAGQGQPDCFGFEATDRLAARRRAVSPL